MSAPSSYLCLISAVLRRVGSDNVLIHLSFHSNAPPSNKKRRQKTKCVRSPSNVLVAASVLLRRCIAALQRSESELARSSGGIPLMEDCGNQPQCLKLTSTALILRSAVVDALQRCSQSIFSAGFNHKFQVVFLRSTFLSY